MDSKCEIISVGTELLLGQIIDTNAAWLSEKLNELGLNVYYQQTVGDNKHRLYKVFKQAQERSNIVFVTGGLGPTEDDLTREVAAELFDTTLTTDDDTMDKIESFFQKRQLSMTSNNRKQALSFKGGTVFENKVGMAPGLKYEYEGVIWFFLPGVPKEMKWIINEQIIPYLYQIDFVEGKLYHRTLTFQGIGESTLETKLIDLIQTQSNPTIAPLAGNGYVTIRLTAKSKSEQEASKLLDQSEHQILSRVHSYFVGYGNLSIEKQLINLLKEHGLTCSSCESLTGGLFAAKLVEHRGVSQLFKGSIISYQNEIKEKVVGIPREVLDQDGAVSERCARLMAENTLNKLSSDIAISFTGVAGPDPLEGHQPGTVYIAISQKGKDTICQPIQLVGERSQIREEAVQSGLKLLLSELNKR
ncbi:competence/damage-inducible protein A [Alkalibacillus aidingensis]|uniref:competence/damage-inducible protein A n=1 Tax=Alkalibacillus aidingensis TaxID=2747607 RepID=UPI001660F77D|nr:competence/damage-inducible protein A [Alkalibacillus aidingensis]